MHAQVQHWVWPLFTERFEGIRERLGLAPLPFHHPITQDLLDPLPPAPPLLYGEQAAFTRFWRLPPGSSWHA